MLTPKQEKFCQGIISGLSGKEAYQAAYNSGSDNAAMVESTKLLAREDIQAKLKELRKPIESLAQTQAISEREKKKKIIWEGIEACRNSGDHNGIARYMDILNKMDAEYININRNIDDNASAVKDLDEETLKKLSGQA